MTPGERLAKAVRDRRLALGELTQAQVTERGGPSTETLRLIENARQPRFGDRTLLRLDRALAWPDGTSAKILAGTATAEDIDEVVLRNERVQRGLGLPRDAVTGAGRLSEGFGVPQKVSPTGIESGEEFGAPTVKVGDTDPRTAVVTVTEIVARLAKQSDDDPAAEDALARLRRILPELWGERHDDSKGPE